MSEYSTRNIIDFAYEDDGKAMRDALYANIHDRITAHLEDKKREIAQNLIASEEKELEIEVPEVEDELEEEKEPHADKPGEMKHGKKSGMKKENW